MPFKLSQINARAERDPGAFVNECEQEYHCKVSDAAARIAEHSAQSPIVLLSGPSGSGKTTTAKKICDALAAHGVRAMTVSLDHYFITLDPKTAPRTEDGELDRESPLCLDLELLNTHFDMLQRGEEIVVPYFSFKLQSRCDDRGKPMRLARDEIVVFEGIHALNSLITDRHPEAMRLYISARSGVEEHGRAVFKGTWMRLLRRVVRDDNFRGTDARETLGMWANVRRGEKRNISPFKTTAHIMFDSSLPYEVSAMKRFALSVFNDIPDGADRFDELRSILPALELFRDIDAEIVPPDSIVREFIGGGQYEY